jgi:NADH-quinone oxidoreductase subunit N
LDVFQASHYYIIFFIAIPVKIIVVFIFIILLNYTFILSTNIYEIFFLSISILSLFLATFGILYQTQLKRFLAYSTINNMSYILLGISTGHFYGIYSSIIYLINYILLMLILCSIFMILVTKFKNVSIIYIIQLSGFFRDYPFLTFLLVLVFFSMIGIPPLSGFWGKFYILQSIFLNIQNNLQIYLWISVIISIFITSILSCFAYLRIIKIIFLETVKKEIKLICNTIYLQKFIFFVLGCFACGIIFFSFIFLYNKQCEIFCFDFLKSLFFTYALPGNYY